MNIKYTIERVPVTSTNTKPEDGFKIIAEGYGSKQELEKYLNIIREALQIHKITNKHGGKGIAGWIQPVCSCGWAGSKHYAHNDYQHSNVKEQAERHIKANR